MNERLMNLSLDDKVEKSKEIILEAIERFGEEKTAVAWTSGKDSTVLLNLIREVYNDHVPISVFFVDTGKHFDEVYRFRDALHPYNLYDALLDFQHHPIATHRIYTDISINTDL